LCEDYLNDKKHALKFARYALKLKKHSPDEDLYALEVEQGVFPDDLYRPARSFPRPARRKPFPRGKKLPPRSAFGAAAFSIRDDD
jgi:hypothetical protein